MRQERRSSIQARITEQQDRWAQLTASLFILQTNEIRHKEINNK